MMNDALIANWNATISKDDIVYHLGDLALWKWEDVESVVKQLNGYIILIKGSHDHHSVRSRMNWAPYLSLNIGPYHCLLNHRPIWEFRSKEKEAAPKSDYDSEFSGDIFKKEKYDFVLCGHSHNLWKFDGKNINLSVENINHIPISETQLLGILDVLFMEGPESLISDAAPDI